MCGDKWLVDLLWWSFWNMQKYVIYMLLNSDVGQLYVKDKQKKL